jgi:ketosteroid isomerase-like protein
MAGARIALPLLAAVLVAAGPAPELASLDAEWSATVARKDQAAFLSRVAPDAVFSGGDLQVGREAIGQKWARYFTLGGPTLRWKPTDSGLAASGDLGWTVGDAVFEWKEKGVAPAPGRYVTVWVKDASGRWMASLDASLEPASEKSSARIAARTLSSRDGTMEASIGTWDIGEGKARKSGTFRVIREQTGGAWRVVQDSEVPAPPAK